MSAKEDSGQYWLLKTEPSTFGVEHLAAAPRRTTSWTGVRNYQARNFIRDAIRPRDPAFLYHSSCAQPGIVAILEVTRGAYADPSALDPHDPHYDPASGAAAPRWYTFDVRLRRQLKRVISLETLRAHTAGPLRDLLILRPGNRLSITPVTAAQWQFILTLE